MSRLPVLFGIRSSERFIGLVIGFAIFTDLFLYGLVVPVLPYALTPRFGIPSGQVQAKTSVLLAIYAAGLLVTCPFVGWCADASRARRSPLLVGLFALAGSTVMFTVGRVYALLVVARILQGVSAAVVWTVGLALLVDTVGKDRLGVAMGTVVSPFLGLGIALGPVVGGIVYDVGGYYAPFYIAFGFIAIDIVMRLIIIEKRTAKLILAAATAESGTHHRQQDAPVMVEGERVKQGEPPLEVAPRRQEGMIAGERKGFVLPPIVRLLRYPRLLTGCWVGFVAAVLFSAFDAVLPLYLKDLWDFSPLASGLVYGALALPSLVFSPVAGWWVDTRGTKSICLLGLLLEIPLLTVLRFPDATSPRAGQIAEMCLLLGLNSFGLSCVLTASMTEIALVVEEQENRRPGLFGASGAVAQGYALFNMSFSVGTLVGPLLAGAVRDRAGWDTMAWSLSLFAAVSLPPCLFFTGGNVRETHWFRPRSKGDDDNVDTT